MSKMTDLLLVLAMIDAWLRFVHHTILTDSHVTNDGTAIARQDGSFAAELQLQSVR